ncbi:MAG: hypothetical protein JXR83_16065, partial [Deltaproteobacteria bacterium]|nr:hypothetical protein [Deltaproteobacteria bacterium]
LPRNFFCSPLVPRGEVLARASAMVFHGGNATMYQAIQHRVPMVAVPGHFDHDLNARALTRAGVGRHILPYDLTAAGLRQAVAAVIDDPAIEANLQRLSNSLAATDPPDSAARIVAAAAAARDPRRARGFGGMLGHGRGGAPWRADRTATQGDAT